MCLFCNELQEYSYSTNIKAIRMSLERWDSLKSIYTVVRKYVYHKWCQCNMFSKKT